MRPSISKNLSSGSKKKKRGRKKVGPLGGQHLKKERKKKRPLVGFFSFETGGKGKKKKTEFMKGNQRGKKNLSSQGMSITC